MGWNGGGGGGGAGAVSSVFTRTGAITAQIGDYTAAQVTGAADAAGANTFTADNQFESPTTFGTFTPNTISPWGSSQVVTIKNAGGGDGIGHVMQTIANGDFTGDTGTDPGWRWGFDVFTTTGSGNTDGNGLTNLVNEIETAIRAGAGTTIQNVDGLLLAVDMFGATAAATVNVARVLSIGTVNRAAGATAGSFGTVYGLYLHAQAAQAGFIGTAYTAYSDGGAHQWNGTTEMLGQNFGDTPLQQARAGFSETSVSDSLYGRTFSLWTPNRTQGTGTFDNTHGTYTYTLATASAPPTSNMATSGAANGRASTDASGGSGMLLRVGAATDAYAGCIYHDTCFYPDASYANTGAGTGSRLVGGLVSSPSTAYGNDHLGATNPALAFNYSNVNGGATDTNWQFITCDGAAQTITDTGLVFTAGHLYARRIEIPRAGTTVFWKITDLTSGVIKSGTVTTHLPAAATALNGTAGVQSIDAIVRNVQAAKLYVAPDKG